MPTGRLETVRKKRVCCFCERWESGGIESFLYNVLARIDLDQLEVDIVAVSLGESIFTHLLQEHNVQFLELSGSQKKVADNHRRFRALLKERCYDVLHLNAFQGLSLSYLPIAKQEGIPVRIAHSHNTALRKSPALPLKLVVHAWAKARYTRDATDLWACSKNAAKFLFSGCELNQKGFQFIPNGIDTKRFCFAPTVRDAVRAELGLGNMFVLGNVGRLCYQKNQDFLLDVFAEVLRRNPDSCLLLVGEGEDKFELQKKAKRLYVNDKVLFYGVSDRVERLLWAMDAFVLPSRFEGLPVTGVEAQATGVPCFFSDAVTRECQITDVVHFLPLSAGSGEWAKRLLEMPNRLPDSVDDVKNAGFDISQVAEKIQAFYER